MCDTSTIAAGGAGAGYQALENVVPWRAAANRLALGKEAATEEAAIGRASDF